MAPCVRSGPSSARKSPPPLGCHRRSRSRPKPNVLGMGLIVHLALGAPLRRHPRIQKLAQGARLRRTLLTGAEAGCERLGTDQLVTEALEAECIGAFTQIALRL